MSDTPLTAKLDTRSSAAARSARALLSTRDVERPVDTNALPQSPQFREALAQRLLRRPAIRRQLMRAGMRHAERIPLTDWNDMIQDLAGCNVSEAITACARRDGTMASFEPSCPIRIAWPQHDRLIPYPRYRVAFAELIPGAEIIMLPGVGHAAMYDDPALVAQAIMHVTNPATTGNGNPRPVVCAAPLTRNG